MPMTAAERQKRYRDKLKEANQRLQGERERFARGLRDSYFASGVNLLQLHDDPAARTALREFARHIEAGVDIVRIMEEAGKVAALELYERERALAMAPRQRRVVYLQGLKGNRRR